MYTPLSRVNHYSLYFIYFTNYFDLIVKCRCILCEFNFLLLQNKHYVNGCLGKQFLLAFS